MSNHVEEMKKFKGTPWSRFVGGIRSRLRLYKHKKTKYHVTTITVWTVTQWISSRTGTTTDPTSLPSWFDLYERGDGQRSWVFTPGAESMLPNKYRVMHDIIKPWMRRVYTNQSIIDWSKTTHKEPQ